MGMCSLFLLLFGGVVCLVAGMMLEILLEHMSSCLS